VKRYGNSTQHLLAWCHLLLLSLRRNKYDDDDDDHDDDDVQQPYATVTVASSLSAKRQVVHCGDQRRVPMCPDMFRVGLTGLEVRGCEGVKMATATS